LHWQVNSLIVAMEITDSPLYLTLPRIVSNKILSGQFHMEVFHLASNNRACTIMDGETAVADIKSSETYGVMIGDCEYTDPTMYEYWLEYKDADFGYARTEIHVNGQFFADVEMAIPVFNGKRSASPSLECSESLPPALRDERLPPPKIVEESRASTEARVVTGQLPQVGQPIKMRFDYNPATFRGGNWYQGWVTFVDRENDTVDMKFKDGDKLSEQNWALLVARGIVKCM
jgi:hypothetical protein